MRVRSTLLSGLLAAGCVIAADEWRQFRGPNSSGVSGSTGLPVRFGPSENVIWKTPLPPGHSSPVFTPDRIFLTALDEGKLQLFCLERKTGKILWRREVPRPRQQALHKNNHPASPSPVTDGTNVYAFFTDFGLVSYGPDGNERWRTPLGPFNNPFGMGASPVLAGDKLIQVCDAETGSFVVAVDRKDGRVRWRVERPEMTRGFSTPLIYQPREGAQQALVAGSHQLIAYSVDTGEAVWWSRGLTWQLKPTPVLGADTIYVLGWAGGSDTGQQENLPSFQEILARLDANKDGKLTPDELTDNRMKQDFKEADLDTDGALGERDWIKYQGRRSAQNSVLAVRLGGRGDVTATHRLWSYEKSLPNTPSPLLYQNVLYLLKEGGIVTSLDPANGTVLKQGRLTGALDQYFASPVGADGKIYAVSQTGHVAVLKAGAQWEILAVNEMDEECFATPAMLDGRIYLRTRGALYCFGQQ